MNKLDEFKSMHSMGKVSDKIFEFIYGCAMRDAILQKAFIGEKRWVYDVHGAKIAVKKYIDSILGNTIVSQEQHDKIFLATADIVCREINNYANKPSSVLDDFTFGNAQKLINITVKHFYSICYYDCSMANVFKFCHCPMDFIMLENVWGFYAEFEGCDNKKRKQDFGNDFLKSWGREDFEFIEGKIDFPKRYLKYQEIVKKWAQKVGCTPIEFDFYFWNMKR